MIKISDIKSPGFDVLYEDNGRCIAMITAAPSYGEPKILKRHMLTEESYILISGEATLYVEEDGALKSYILEARRLYTIPAATWHHLKVSDDALLAVVESSGTIPENTESKPI